MIYFDNAATSFPKPKSVVKAVSEAFVKYGANPGRGGHEMSVKTAEKVFEARQLISDLFNGSGAENVCFTSNCTQALNTAINGFVNRGEHIVISCFEHNSVLRPVHLLKEKGIADYSVFNVGKTDDETIDSFKNSLRNNTKMCVITAVSNVFGDALPLEKIGKIAKEKGITFVVDGAQGAGVIPINMKEMNIDCLCVPGHKGLMGPMGTGAIILNGVKPKPLTVGGTGTFSKSFTQPLDLPENLESGTLNVPGICGLCEGVRFVLDTGVDKIFSKEHKVCNYIAEKLTEINGAEVYYPRNNSIGSLVSFNLKNMHSETVALLLSREGVAVRGGYHCSPLAHNYVGTDRVGTVRISPSFFTQEKDIKNLLNLVRKIAFHNNI